MGAESVKVDGGTAAVFRFKGQANGANAPGGEVIVPIWIAIADGGQAIAITPEGAAPPDQALDFTEMFRSLRFTHVAAASATTGRRHATKIRTVRVVPVVEAERYEGRLYPDDRQFALSLHANGTASAEWKRPNMKTEVLTGKWSGEDGQYVVRLSDGMTLSLQRNGPKESGFMLAPGSGKRVEIVGLNMVSIPVKGSAAAMYGVMFR
jgi:hypothetical protein